MSDIGIVGSLKEQGKAILVMMAVAIVSVLAMIVLNIFTGVTQSLTGLGATNASDPATANETITTTLSLFITAFALTGSFASIGVLIIIVKGIIGVVRGLN